MPGGQTETLEQAVARATRYLRRRDVAAKLDISERHLEKLAATGEGPPLVKIGRTVRYPEDMLDQWARSRMGGVAK